MILDGLGLRDKILENLKVSIEKENLDITLAIIQVGSNDASNIYVRNKIRACEMVGIKCILKKLDEDVLEDDIIKIIDEFNNDDSITGIILQSPITKGLDYDKCSSKISSKKDVDGFTKENIYNLYLGRDGIIPCTVKGILRLFEEYNIDLVGKNVLVIGRGNIVGKPLGLLLLNKNATVTYAHSYTKNLSDLCKMSDIIISATGKGHLIKSDMISDGVILVDVGVTRLDGKIVGDIDFDNCIKKASFITPNPKGVGPMTVAMIIDNLVEMKRREKNG